MKSNERIKSCFKIDGALIADQREIANEFNIARNMNAKLCSSRPVDHVDSGSKNFTDYLGNRVSSSMFLFDPRPTSSLHYQDLHYNWQIRRKQCTQLANPWLNNFTQDPRLQSMTESTGRPGWQ